MTKFFPDIVKYSIEGPITFGKVNGRLVYAGRPSSFFLGHDSSTKEVGGLLFIGTDKYYFLKNENPNMEKTRTISLEDVRNIVIGDVNEL